MLVTRAGELEMVALGPEKTAILGLAMFLPSEVQIGTPGRFKTHGDDYIFWGASIPIR